MSEMVRGKKVDTRRISAGTTQSQAVDARGFAFYGMLVPAGATAANITFEVSDDAATWYPLKDKTGAAVAAIPITTGVGGFDLPTELASFPYFRAVSSVNQVANLDLKFCKKA